MAKAVALHLLGGPVFRLLDAEKEHLLKRTPRIGSIGTAATITSEKKREYGSTHWDYMCSTWEYNILWWNACIYVYACVYIYIYDVCVCAYTSFIDLHSYWDLKLSFTYEGPHWFLQWACQERWRVWFDGILPGVDWLLGVIVPWPNLFGIMKS